MTKFEVAQIIMPMYIKSAERFLQLSIGALGLSLVFREKVLGAQAGSDAHYLLMGSWALYLFAIGASSFYQYLAVKYIDYVSDHRGKIPWGMKRLVTGPGVVYGLMLCFFTVASVLLVASAAISLSR
jgi:hypothetical protein